MNDKVTGIVLGETDYRDYDVILNVLTKDLGKISFTAAGIRKMTSRNRGSVLPYTIAEFQFDYKEGKTMFRMKTAKTVRLHKNIHDDLERMSAAAVICDTVNAMTISDEEHLAEEEYDILENALGLLDEGRDILSVTALFLSEILRISGISPDVDECAVCGANTVSAISVKEGGFLCAECAAKAGEKLREVQDLRRFRVLCKAGLEHIDIIESTCRAEVEDLDILIRFLRTYAGTQIRSFEFFRSLFSIV